MDRDKLRAECWKLYRQYRDGGFAVFCPICGRKIDGPFDLHEYLVKRSVVPRDAQELIMVPENCLPLHHACHMKEGQTQETTRKCLWHAARVLEAQRIGEWYVSLWKRHGLSVPKGLLVAPRDLPPYSGKKLYELGCKLVEYSVAEESAAKVNTAFLYLSGRIKRNADVKKLENMQLLTPTIERLSEGLWLDYLLGVIG